MTKDDGSIYSIPETIHEGLMEHYTTLAKQKRRYYDATDSQIEQYEADLSASITSELRNLDDEINVSLNPSNNYPPSPISIWYE